MTHGVTGIIAAVDAPEDWIAALRRLSRDDVFAEKLRAAGRAWVEEHYDAHKNAARLRTLMQRALAP